MSSTYAGPLSLEIGLPSHSVWICFIVRGLNQGWTRALSKNISSTCQCNTASTIDHAKQDASKTLGVMALISS
eukprot:scaffold33955_cov155-Skeletonema_dohrnii-CCMP3373.AAC.1